MKLPGYAIFLAVILVAWAHAANAQKARVTIATVNNADMIIMQRLSKKFEAANPEIKLDWVVLEENVLRQRVTTDIATGGGQFDIMTIGTYEVPIWGKQGWLTPLDKLPKDYDVDDLLKPVRDGLSYKGRLYAVPFYAESSMTFYRTDLFKKAGLKMPARPTYAQIAKFAATVHDPAKKIYGICLRGKPGWGENMAFVTTLVNAFGGQWFDMKWNTTIDTPEWRKAIGFYVDILSKYGPPGASSNGFNENLTLFANGNCAMWIDATVAAGILFNPKTSKVSGDVGFAQAPSAVTAKGTNFLWSWALAIPSSSRVKDAARKFMLWATSKEYVRLVGAEEGWVAVPPGTRVSTYKNPNYIAAAPFADFVFKAIESADPTDATLKPVPYQGRQFVGIPEFQGIGTQVGQTIAGALVGKTTVAGALAAAQSSTERTMRRAGYRK
jgi:sorbitol/mannitol transport system substrate-binding protein